MARYVFTVNEKRAFLRNEYALAKSGGLTLLEQLNSSAVDLVSGVRGVGSFLTSVSGAGHSSTQDTSRLTAADISALIEEFIDRYNAAVLVATATDDETVFNQMRTDMGVPSKSGGITSYLNDFTQLRQ